MRTKEKENKQQNVVMHTGDQMHYDYDIQYTVSFKMSIHCSEMCKMQFLAIFLFIVIQHTH